MENQQVRQMQPWETALSQSKRKFNEINEVNNFVNYDTEAMFCLQLIRKNDYLMNIANTNPESLRNSVINIAAIGLSLNPATQYAYLVPRGGDCCLDISYKGLIKLATDSGSILWAKAEIVYANDKFEYNGPAMPPNHTADVFSKERGAFQGVYCMAKTKEGDYLVDVMSAEEINQVRDKSTAKTGPWKDWFYEMAKKTIFKRASKTWPKSDKNERIAKAIDVINQHEGIDFDGQMILGIRMDEMIDMEMVNKEKVEMHYLEAVKIIDEDNEEAAPDACRVIKDDLNNEESVVFRKVLGKHKHGRKGYHTIFDEYACTYNEGIDSETV